MARSILRSSLRLTGALAQALALAQPLGCSEDDTDAYQPLSERCADCLERGDTSGCGVELDACEESTACESLVLCELRQQCYTMPPGDCSSVRGCDDGLNAEALELGAAFEACARDTCAASCDFVR